MNANKHSKNATETGAAVISLYRHHFSEAELYSIKHAETHSK